MLRLRRLLCRHAGVRACLRGVADAHPDRPTCCACAASAPALVRMQVLLIELLALQDVSSTEAALVYSLEPVSGALMVRWLQGCGCSSCAAGTPARCHCRRAAGTIC